MSITLDKQRLITLLALDSQNYKPIDANRAKKEISALTQYMNRDRSIEGSKIPRVVIVGGGIIGLMTAFFLNEIGYDITVVESKSFGAAASGRNGGAVMTLGRKLEEIPYSINSLQVWKEITNKGIKTHFEQNGHLIVARNESEEREIELAYQIYKSAGINVTLLNNEQMREHVPFLNRKLKLGLYSYDDAIAYPFTTIQGLLEKLRLNGAKLKSHSPVINIKTKAGRITSVVTPKEEYTGDYFIFATGPWTEQLCKQLGEEVFVQPRRSQIFATEVFRNRVVKPFLSGNGIYLRQTHAGNILFGGGGAWEIDGYKTENTDYAIGLQSKRFIQLFPKFRNKKLLRSFAGTVELTPDRIPILGMLTQYTNGMVSAGYNGHGFGVSAAMGKFASSYLHDYIMDKAPDNTILQMLNILKVDRFKTSN